MLAFSRFIFQGAENPLPPFDANGKSPADVIRVTVTRRHLASAGQLAFVGVCVRREDDSGDDVDENDINDYPMIG